MPSSVKMSVVVRAAGRALAVMGLAMMLAMPTDMKADQGFQRWIRDFRNVAAKSGVERATYDKVFAGISSPDPEVLRAANHQPEFKSNVWDYLDARISEQIIRDGQAHKQQYAGWLDRIESRFGVDRHILLAIWSMESSYGKALEQEGRLHRIARALATLAYADARRAKFARKQLIAAMKIVQAGDISAEGLVGSWAGAMGHTQFIPTSYQAWAVDIDGNGRRDVWNSVPDALASAANLLMKNGWRTGKTWGYEVQLPARFAKSLADGRQMTLREWARAGFRRVGGKAFPRPSDQAVLKLPAGKDGPGFLMLRNFFVLKRYNNADKYALAVGHLADRLRGGDGFVQPWPRGYTPLDEIGRKAVQVHMARLGLYDGDIDGNIGSGSRAAIRAYQDQYGLEQDGVASRELLDKLNGG